MSAEEILISQARSYMFTSKVNHLIKDEITKGCNPCLYPQSVDLEPNFVPIQQMQERVLDTAIPDGVLEQPPNPADIKRFQVWLSPKQPFDWNNNELFVKQLFSVSRRIGFEIIGNSNQILMLLSCHKDDEAILKAVFRGQFACCEITEFKQNPLDVFDNLAWEMMQMQDYYPLPPYSRLLTSPFEFKQSPYETLIQSIASLSPNEFLWYQVLLQPVSPYHNWHQNIEILLDLEYHTKLMSDVYFPHRFAQQNPSGDLHHMSDDANNKAHNDKPMFAAAIRILYLNSDGCHNTSLNALSTFIRFFQHGGRPFHCLTQEDYRSGLTAEQIQHMFLTGTTYRPGFIVNSLELSGLVHLPSSEALKDRNVSMELLETLLPQQSDLSNGTRVGTCVYANQSIPVCIPLPIRLRHTQLIGRSGMGKSCALEQMILDDISKGFGVAVLDPHGDLIDRILCTFPEDAIERTIYFDPGDPDMVPLWNPLTPLPGQDVGRMADDLVNAFKNVVTGWGDRLEHLLRHALFALIQLPNTTLLDVSRLMSFNSPESKSLRKQIQEVMLNESARQFWSSDFGKYGKDDFSPPKHKLSKLLLSDTVSLMLSQPENKFDFRKFMDEGMIVLINLSTIGSETRDILGCFLLAIFRLTALSRANLSADQRRPFHIYCDEAHRFISGAIEDLIAETRKFGVSLTLAHQYLSQFGNQKADALASVGSCIIFNVDTKDARALSKDLRGTVAVEDLITLDVGEAIVRIGTEIVRIKTQPPQGIQSTNCKDQIIAHSHRHYYKPKQEIHSMIHDGFDHTNESTEKILPIQDENFAYDKFD